MKRSVSRVGALATAVLVAGCGGGSPGSPTAAAIVATLAPDTVPPRPCGQCPSLPGELEVAATLTLRETVGLGATVDTVAVTLRSDGGETVVQGQFDAAAVSQLAGTNRLAASGTLRIPVSAHFAPAPSRLPGTFTVTITARDDRGNRLTASAMARVPSS